MRKLRIWGMSGDKMDGKHPIHPLAVHTQLPTNSTKFPMTHYAFLTVHESYLLDLIQLQWKYHGSVHQ